MDELIQGAFWTCLVPTVLMIVIIVIMALAVAKWPGKTR